MSGIEFYPIVYALPLAVSAMAANNRVVRTLEGHESFLPPWIGAGQEQGKRRKTVASSRVTCFEEFCPEPSMEVSINGMPFIEWKDV